MARLYDENKLGDKLNEAFLYGLGYEHANNLSEQTDGLLEEYSDVEVPEKLDKWFSDFIASEEKAEKRAHARRSFNKVGRRAAVVFVILFLMTAVATISVDAFRIKLFNMMIEVNKKFSVISFEETENFDASMGLPHDWEGYYPTRLPEGYRVKNKMDTKPIYNIEFENDASEMIIFTQYPISGVSQLDTEDAEVTETEINGMEGLIVVKENCCIIFWHNDDYIFNLSGNIDPSVLKTVAESVVKK